MTTDTTPAAEEFTDAERTQLEPRFTNTDRRCFALRNLPETVKGALFARYSRSAKSLRRLYLDEFDADLDTAGGDAGREHGGRAAALYDRVLGQYGDDSVAQLGSAHVACEGVSNVLTKILKRGRLMSYLTPPYTDKVRIFRGLYRQLRGRKVFRAQIHESTAPDPFGLSRTDVTVPPAACAISGNPRPLRSGRVLRSPRVHAAIRVWATITRPPPPWWGRAPVPSTASGSPTAGTAPPPPPGVLGPAH